jgi:hypothetical protein
MSAMLVTGALLGIDTASWGVIIAALALVVAASSALGARGSASASERSAKAAERSGEATVAPAEASQRSAGAAEASAQHSERSAGAAERSAAAHERTVELDERRAVHESREQAERDAPLWEPTGDEEAAFWISDDNHLEGVMVNVGAVTASVTAVVLDLSAGGRITGRFRLAVPGPADGGFSSELDVRPGAAMPDRVRGRRRLARPRPDHRSAPPDRDHRPQRRVGLGRDADDRAATQGRRCHQRAALAGTGARLGPRGVM